MKTMMIAAAACTALLAACTQGEAKKETNAAVSAVEDTASGMVGQTSAATLGGNTVEGFVSGLGVTSMYGIQAAEIAATRSQDPKVRELAASLTRGYTASAEKLRAAAGVAATSNPDVTLPTELDERRKGLLDNLRNAAPADFDKVFLEQQVAAHNETLTLLNGFSDNTAAPGLATLARDLVASTTASRDSARTLLEAKP